MKQPENLFDVHTYIDKHKYLTLECDEKEEEINSISKLITIIGEIYLE